MCTMTWWTHRSTGRLLLPAGLVALSLGLVASFNTSARASDIASRVDAFLIPTVEAFEVPGLAIAIVSSDRVVHVSTHGVRSLSTQDALRPEHLFHAASVSKPFVATAIVQLAEKGTLALDDPVVRHLPDFRLRDDRYTSMTIRQMLNHTSGMPDVEDYEWDAPEYDEAASERYVAGLASETLAGEPGRRYRYSNMAFDVLGHLVGKLSGESFEDYVRHRILDPLGMHQSTFLIADADEGLRTDPHVWRWGPVVNDICPYNRRHAPSSTLNTNVVDMARWIRANLNGGELEGQRILSPDNHRLLTERSVQAREDTAIGLSWYLRSHRGVETVSHSGQDTGFTSECTLIPDMHLGFVILSNYDATPMDDIRAGVLDILLGHEPAPLRPSAFDYLYRILYMIFA